MTRTNKKISAVWRYYMDTEDGHYAICTFCQSLISYRTTTSNLRIHLKRKHNIIIEGNLVKSNTNIDTASDANTKKDYRRSPSSSSNEEKTAIEYLDEDTTELEKEIITSSPKRTKIIREVNPIQCQENSIPFESLDESSNGEERLNNVDKNSTELEKTNASLRKRKKIIRKRIPVRYQVLKPGNIKKEPIDIYESVERANSRVSLDDCQIYALGLAMKLRGFTEAERIEIMYELDGVIVKRRREKNKSLTDTIVDSPLLQ